MSNEIIFLDGTVYNRSKLGMVNDSLRAMGETPFPQGTQVDTLQLGTDGDIAKINVEQTMVEVQSRGWFFNMDYSLALIPDSRHFISMPPNTLRVDFGAGPNATRYALKNGQIYDYQNKTFIIDEELEADVVWLVDYGELPPEAYEYISARAARKCQVETVGSTEVYKYNVADEQDAYTNLQRLQLQSQDYNLQNSRVSTRIHNGYLVAGLYGNKGRRRFS